MLLCTQAAASLEFHQGWLRIVQCIRHMFVSCGSVFHSASTQGILCHASYPKERFWWANLKVIVLENQTPMETVFENRLFGTQCPEKLLPLLAVPQEALGFAA